MPGDPRVLQRRVWVTLWVAGAVALLAPVTGALLVGEPFSLGIWFVVPALLVGALTSFVWWRRARAASRAIAAGLLDGCDTTHADAAAFVGEVNEIRASIAERRFWRPSMRAARRGTGARCRELAVDAPNLGLEPVAERLRVLADARDPGRS